MKVGQIIDARFEISGICSTSGGMGNIVFVKDLSGATSIPLVLKYCKSFVPKDRLRFDREIRVLGSFVGNGRIVQILAMNGAHEPPYFVMPYYAEGDLSSHQPSIAGATNLQEELFCKMIDCISELHNAGHFHRDIKPQNFLMDTGKVIVSDFGLSTDPSEATTLTSTAEAWGTLGYTPPEARASGFKDADCPYDVFMLGKTFYNLLSGRDPLYMTPDGIPPGLFHVLQRATNTDKSKRYNSLAEFKQALVFAYDIILNRVQGASKCKNTLDTINSRITNERQFRTPEVLDFIESLSHLYPPDQDSICKTLTTDFFFVISQTPFNEKRQQLLDVYKEMVHKGDYGWGFAENIANCMEQVMNSVGPTENEKAFALGLAIHAAHTQHRFAAMNTCMSMVAAITDDVLAQHVRTVILDHRNTFLSGMEASRCRNDIIARTIRDIAPPPEPPA